MTVVKIVLAVLSVLLLLILPLSLLRIGVRLHFGTAFCAQLLIGPVKRPLYPRKSKEKKTAGEEKAAPAQETPAQKKRLALPALTWAEKKELLHLVYDTAKRTLQKNCRRLRLDPLTVAVVFGGSDPAAAAENYGRANAALFTAMPRLEELLNIPDPAIHLELDYGEEKAVRAEGEVGLWLRVFDALVIAATLLPPLYRWYRRIRKIHATDPAPIQKEPTEHTVNNESLSA